MKKSYINGFILSVPDYITSVNFIKDKNPRIQTKIERDTGNYINRPYRIMNNIDTNIIDIIYTDGLIIDEFPKKYVQPCKSVLMEYQGKLVPQKTVSINGIEYILHENNKFNAINVFLVHYNYEKGITENKCIVRNNSVYYFLVDKIYKDWTVEDYCNYINSSNYVYANIVDKDKFNISNIYSCAWNNSNYDYYDPSITGLTDELYINDIVIAADFVRKMREFYPEIQFYTGEEQKDTTKYNEWVNYKIVPSEIKSDIFTSRIVYTSTYGRIWQTTFNVDLEYISNDLPTLLSRRDQFRLEEFFWKHQKLYVTIKTEKGVDFPCQYVIYWNRDNLDTEYKITTSDDLGSSQFSFFYKAKIAFTNVEHSPRKSNIVEKVIAEIFTVPEIQSDNNGLTMPDDSETYDKNMNTISNDFDVKNKNILKIDKSFNDLEHNTVINTEEKNTTIDVDIDINNEKIEPKKTENIGVIL